MQQYLLGILTAVLCGSYAMFLNNGMDDLPMMARYRFQSLTPRGASMVSGRGFAPGFIDRPLMDTKRSVQNIETELRRNLSPRGAAMISGRGFRPGFLPRQDFFSVEKKKIFNNLQVDNPFDGI